MNTDENEDKKVRDALKVLEIPCEPVYSQKKNFWVNAIDSKDLYDILMDEEKLRVLVSKLRNKAFW